MIKDAIAKLFLIPLLGICIALLTGAVFFSSRTVSDAAFCSFFWILVTFLLWQGTVVTIAYIRNQRRIRENAVVKVSLLLFCSMAVALLITGLATTVWTKLFQNPIPQTNAVANAFILLAIGPLIGLTYEIFFLQKEQELDSKIVAQLDYERQIAELQALKNELDPHFIFNALNVLSPLISIDASKAQVFTIKLAQVYKYLLRNKDRELVTLQEELCFIQDYFFLLQIRHGSKLRLKTDLNEIDTHQVLILPFALQMLVENAIKHNQFSDTQPLEITISADKQNIRLCNTVNKNPYCVNSLHVGLKNLNARYKLICNKAININQTADTYLVKLPLIKMAV